MNDSNVGLTKDRLSLSTAGRGNDKKFASNNASSSGSQNQILKAVVLDCISDVSKYNNNILSGIEDLFDSSQFTNRMVNVANSVTPKDGLQTEFHLKAPRNSLVLKLIDNGDFSSEDKEGNFNQLIVAYPFFSSHLMLPCKPGEIVWCLQDVTGNGYEYYWLSRVHGQEYVEDANYTHLDRNNLYNHFISEKYKDYIDDFLNGENWIKNQPVNDDNIKFTLPIQSDDSNPFDKIFKNSLFNNLNLEPVPRITPKIGDVVLQGSNNNAIILTTNRFYDVEKKIIDGQSNSSNINKEFLEPLNGCIDLVVGRGRFPNQNNQKSQEIFEKISNEPLKNTTVPRVYKNTRDYYEADKNPIIRESKKDGNSNIKINSSEGDPDLKKDSARIYLSNKLNIDKSLGFIDKYPKIVLANSNDNSPSQINFEEKQNNSVALIKSDEVRIVARKDEENKINGSIKIIKEGNRETNSVSQDQAIIILEKDGSIFIDGPKIVIGTGKGEVNGQGTQISLGYGASEPLVLGNQLVDKLNRFIDEVVKLLEALTLHTHATPAGPSTPPVDPSTWSENIINLTLLQGELTEVLITILKTI